MLLFWLKLKCPNKYDEIIKYIILLFNVGSKQCTKRIIVDTVDITLSAKTKGTIINTK